MTLTISKVSRAVGGPKMITGNETGVNTDTSNNIDLTSYLQDIEGVVHISAWKAASAHTIATIDYTTTAGVLATTFADPTENITIYFTIMGR